MRLAFLFTFLLGACLLAATGSIAGKVISDATGEGLSGISVVLQDTGTGVVTNPNGGYIIKNLPVGQHTLNVSVIGYEPQKVTVQVREGQTSIANVRLVIKPYAIEGLTVSANRAIKRETPIAFSTLDESQLTDKYTTQDIPQLMDDVPGLFSSSNGLGESEITMRGFDADKIQILINGIPVNDPESQQVYWSNWTGLSSNVKSVQVQRGAGSSLYGSGAFGGSVNIETMGSSINREIEVRASAGAYETSDKVADAKGGMDEYNPINYNVSVRYKSGMLHNGKYNYSFMAERKAGDSYIIGTNYDGWSFGAEAATLLGQHSVNYSFIAAPQAHNQARKTTDMELIPYLGREYNRNNCSEQENYYFKPQFSVRDEWTISSTQSMMTNAFFTIGKGGGKYLYNDTFDGNYFGGNIPTGEIGYKNVSYQIDNKWFSRHARWAYETAGVVLDGYDPTTNTYVGWDPDTGAYSDTMNVGPAKNLVASTYDNSWLNDGQNDHLQLGMNTYYEHKLSDQVTLTVGGEMRHWEADHYAESYDFRYYDTSGTSSDNVAVYDQVQDRYNYSSIVDNLSGFIRAQYKPFPEVNIVLDGQWARYYSEIIENPVEIYDFRAGRFTGKYYYATKNIVDENGDKLFDSDDYKKTFRFFSPKVGFNLNITPEINYLANFSVAYKEPKTYEWYDRVNGPNQGQVYEEGNEQHTYTLKPEKTTTFEMGLGYTGIIFDTNVNYYITEYVDKIESVTDDTYGSITMNAGRARHMGWEISTSAAWNHWDASASTTISRNRWLSMSVDQIFHTQSSNVVGKVVPFSPERMANGALGYTFEKMPLHGKLRIGLSTKWWDHYFGTYTNDYEITVETVDSTGAYHYTTKTISSRLPHFFELNGDIKYDFVLGKTPVTIKLDLNNITDRDKNYTSAAYSADYGTNNALLNSDYYMYVSPAPRFNVFLTTSVKF